MALGEKWLNANPTMKSSRIAGNSSRIVVQLSLCRQIENTSSMEPHDLLSYSFCRAILYRVAAQAVTQSQQPPPVSEPEHFEDQVQSLKLKELSSTSETSNRKP
ncbi:hypothetical protein LguiB_017728 [Lonicera macranthoides]